MEDDNMKKRRGRKPVGKVVDSEVKEVKQVPKKRGRRPKDKTYVVINSVNEVPAEVEDDNIILHLPMRNTEDTNDNDVSINAECVMKYDPVLNEPMPYEPFNNMQSDYALISDNILDKIGEENEEKLEDEEIIPQVKESVDDDGCVREIGFEDMDKNYYNILKKAKILKHIASEDSKKEWDVSTDSVCFYCTEGFKTVPIGIPVRYLRGKFHCRDNFCSFNCAAAYIFSGIDIKYHFRKWEYYSLLCMMASVINKEIKMEKGEDVIDCIMKVKLAEDRNLLKKFGGPLSIEKFREQFYVLDSKYSLLYPPLSCMYPQAEVAQFVSLHRQKAHMLNSESKFSGQDMRLKREKPLIQKKNTLEEYMSLKIK